MARNFGLGGGRQNFDYEADVLEANVATNTCQSQDKVATASRQLWKVLSITVLALLAGLSVAASVVHFGHRDVASEEQGMIDEDKFDNGTSQNGTTRAEKQGVINEDTFHTGTFQNGTTRAEEQGMINEDTFDNGTSQNGTTESGKTQNRSQALGCCSWNSEDCGHGDNFCQEGPHNCQTCNGKWGNFNDPCAWGHPPALPLPKINIYGGKMKLGVKILTYNLEWWKTGGGAAPFVMESSSKKIPYDVMGFQECENPWQLLWQADWQSDYHAIHVAHGRAVQLCIAYRNTTWTLLSSGDMSVSQDQTYGSRYTMWVRLQHIKTREIMFFANHQGPLPLNLGGIPGSPSTGSALLGQVAHNSQPGDAIILVGDFNADGGSLTIRQLECRLRHVAWGDKYNGVDNIFANVAFSHISKGHGKSLYGGNSDHDALEVFVDLSPKDSDMAFL
mmetsp:Transcript_26010/g.49819  ORF Transcript_26010/g.49819 Transcript_26010/m.49819 type:complete len:447 (+) Transcript_26010:94-1434(+)